MSAEKEKKNKEIKMVTKKSEEEKSQLQQQQDVKNKTSTKRKHRQAFPFGNYKSYYGYRIGHDMDEDPRLKVFRKEWFEGKDCLDVGCNSGIITICVAKKFHCQSILGIDIDHNRVEDAWWHLRKFMKLEFTEKERAKRSVLEHVVKGNGSEHINNSSSNEETTESVGGCSPSGERDLSQIVSFQQENFVQGRHQAKKCYDTIMCLSVTKWIHLNWGDDGLITLFTKIWKLLRPGGIFILEPQPWKSYESNRRVSEKTATNYRNIILRPEHFGEILLDKVGFRTVEELTSSLSGSKAGFDRPIFVFRK